MDAVERKRVFRWTGIAAVVLAALLGSGTLAFALIGNENAEKSFYRAFGDLTRVKLVGDPNGPGERAVAAILTIAGAIFYLALLGTVVQAIVVRNAFAETIRDRRRRRRMSELSGHFIVCGYGNVGRAVTKALIESGEQVVVIDVKPENADDAERDGAKVGKHGDADECEVLEAVGIQRAQGLIATVGSDAQNLYIALAARRCNPDIYLAARASDEEARENLEYAELFQVVKAPYASAGNELAHAARTKEGA